MTALITSNCGSKMADHLGLCCDALPEHQTARITSDCAPLQVRGPVVALTDEGPISRRRDCHLTDTPLFIPIETPTTGTAGVPSNDTLADGY